MRYPVVKVTALLATVWLMLSQCSAPVIAGLDLGADEPVPENALQAGLAPGRFTEGDSQGTTWTTGSEERPNSGGGRKRGSPTMRGGKFSRLVLLSRPSALAPKFLVGVTLVAAAILTLGQLGSSLWKCLGLVGASKKTSGLTPRSLQGEDKEDLEACLLNELNSKYSVDDLTKRLKNMTPSQIAVATAFVALTVVLLGVLGATLMSNHGLADGGASSKLQGEASPTPGVRRLSGPFDVECVSKGLCIARELQTEEIPENKLVGQGKEKALFIYVPKKYAELLRKYPKVLDGWAEQIEEDPECAIPNHHTLKMLRAVIPDTQDTATEVQAGTTPVTTNARATPMETEKPRVTPSVKVMNGTVVGSRYIGGEVQVSCPTAYWCFARDPSTQETKDIRLMGNGTNRQVFFYLPEHVRRLLINRRDVLDKWAKQIENRSESSTQDSWTEYLLPQTVWPPNATTPDTLSTVPVSAFAPNTSTILTSAGASQASPTLPASGAVTLTPLTTQASGNTSQASSTAQASSSATQAPSATPALASTSLTSTAIQASTEAVGTWSTAENSTTVPVTSSTVQSPTTSSNTSSTIQFSPAITDMSATQSPSTISDGSSATQNSTVTDMSSASQSSTTVADTPSTSQASTDSLNSSSTNSTETVPRRL
ncbi:hypothetical protein CSUI_000227 [Cystoisospora suis]|uniref:Transmembrane protein n=1 Tax=Cystoisospora suis TaxID=483139 RepID=A0A2C6LGE8_9APIC|nr:hypothetical protein CSUI_000227 [Cystoisospora suis]